jgi:mono/diheme cytochrome c family protein
VIARTSAVIAAAGLAAGWSVLATQPSVRAADTVTFSEHVAPIIYAHCASCHRPGEAAPFPLLTYADAKQRATLIAKLTASRRMPPWKAGPSDYEFRNARTLSAADIATLKAWADAGAPEGETSRAPAPPAFTAGWQLGRPDLVVSMPEPYTVRADGPDIYRNFVLPLNLPEDTWVSAVDFRPSARSVVHHSLFFLDDTGAARMADERDPLPGYSGTMGGSVGLAGLFGLFNGRSGRGGGAGPALGATPDLSAISRASNNLGGWAVGAQARALPDGLAYLVPKGSDLILSTHFHPSGKQEQEASTVGLYFAKQPPAKKFSGIMLPALFGVFSGIHIPAGDAHYTIDDWFTLPVDVKAFDVTAHAHYLAKEMTLTATFPDGPVKTLLWIQDWDFSWQDQYAFKDFVALPKGTVLHASISYDNSSANPRNPNTPPRRVSWGEQSTDEMGSINLQIVAADEAELPRLRQSYVEHLRDAALASPDLGRFLQWLNRGRGRRGQRP